MLRSLLTALVAAHLVTGCGGSQAPEGFSPVALNLPTIAAERQTMPRERSWDGVVEAVDKATLSAQTRGRVLELAFDVNDYVEAGEVVVRFSDVEQQSVLRSAQAAVAAAQAEFDEAEAEFKRISEVFERKLVARAQLDQATARRDASRARLDAARASQRDATQQVDYTVVRAPYPGILTERHVEIGESVQPGQPLVSGLSLNRLRVNVQIPQGDVGAVRELGQAWVLLDDGRRIPAQRVVVFPYADAATHSFSVRLELAEAETGLQPGMTVKSVFKLGEVERLLVPTRALVQRGELSAVYVQGGDGRPQLRQVRVGAHYEDRIEILAGLSAGEAVVGDPLAALAALNGQQGALPR